MRVTGVIAEYNPLHNGHVYHLQEARERTHCDYLIVVMSGDYVQRGEPAIADKYVRARWALAAGADLVLELPSVFAISSAERFAYGGVRTLTSTGVLDALCFGSEIEDAALLQDAAHLLANETLVYQKRLREELSTGKSYPRARYDAWQACGAPPTILRVLREPNCILGVEYIRSLLQLQSHAVPVLIPRVGGGYNQSALTGMFSSATAIREALLLRQHDALSCMPPYVSERFVPGGPTPISLSDAQTLMLYALRRMPLKELERLPDVQEGFENVLFRAARDCQTLEALFSILKSKRYTYARCKRMLLCALLGIDKALLATALEPQAAYLHVLGFREQSRALLSAIGKKCKAPLLLRHADIAALPESARTLLDKDIQAHDIYTLLAENQVIPRDFAALPVRL